MKTQMKKDGKIAIISETELETYAMKKWIEENETPEQRMANIIFMTLAELVLAGNNPTLHPGYEPAPPQAELNEGF